MNCLPISQNASSIKLFPGILLITDSPADKTPKHLSFICGVTYVGAMLASNASLKWVNYPTQVLGKSCKPIPVMILGVFLAG